MPGDFLCPISSRDLRDFFFATAFFVLDAFEVAFFVPDGVISKTRELALEGTYHQDEAKDDESLTEWLVPISWIKTVSIEDAISETGLFGNQNTVCRPRSQKWNQTVERLARHWGISVD